MKPIQRILIANRGEIACRIAKSCKKRNTQTVCVFTANDKDSPHVSIGDQAIEINDYLNIEEVVHVSIQLNCDAIHPGYGFLAENADLAQACADNQITFIGPSIEHIRIMGCKILAKLKMAEAGLPTIPSLEDANEIPPETLKNHIKDQIGFPVIVKAAKGGGGKGMIVVREARQLEMAIASAKREAQSSFGNQEILIEKYLEATQHIEVQVFGDQNGQVTHLFERNCSAQRHHQKIIEETPAITLTQETRAKLFERAVAACKHIGYFNAGTIEFLIQGDEFYFLEMNTRLQVEHPITEMLTGHDLVEWQISIAEGQPLTQIYELSACPTGHAIEVRICAEDPVNGFLPQVGCIDDIKWAEENCGLRIDSGIQPNQVITTSFDSMLAKLIAYSSTREVALDVMSKALGTTHISGIGTNIDYLHTLISHPNFADGDYDTSLLAGFNYVPNSILTFQAACLFVAFLHFKKTQQNNPWYSLVGYQITNTLTQNVSIYDETGNQIDVTYSYHDQIFSFISPLKWELTGNRLLNNKLDFIADELYQSVSIFQDKKTYWVKYKNSFQFSLTTDFNCASDSSTEDLNQLHSPLPGKVVALHCSNGDIVNKDQVLVVIEAMKIEHKLTTPGPAKVISINCKIGDSVSSNQQLIDLEKISKATTTEEIALP